MTSYRFPTDFIFGTATAAYQIEGAAMAGGRKPSVWDVMATRTGETGRLANDHYRLFREDIALMASLGLRHYRMSLAWPRIIPDGRGQVNEAGIDFYKQLLDCLGEHGITPYVTLFHWDTPLALEQRYGGWRSREIADDLATYCTEAVRRLGDRVRHWYTINEIPCFTQHSYTAAAPAVGMHAPGLRLASQKEVNQTTFHALLAHGRAVQAIRASTPQPCQVALVDNTGTPVPLTESPADIAAARAAYADSYHNAQIIYPVLTGKHGEPWATKAKAAGEFPDMQPGDLELIHQPLDAFGFNVYSGQYIRAADTAAGYATVPFAEGYPRMAMPWLQIVPESIYWAPRHVRDILGYQGDLYITENGCAADDVLTPQGEVLDNDRILYLRAYLRQVHRAVAEGLPLKGYFLWSFLDNFEWAWGYSKRFGMIWNSYETQTRIPKASAHWYAECIRQGRVV